MTLTVLCMSGDRNAGDKIGKTIATEIWGADKPQQQWKLKTIKNITGSG